MILITDRCVAKALLATLVGTRSPWPIEDVREPPRVLAQIQLQFALFIKDELRLGIEGARALALVLVIDVDEASGEIEGLRLGVEEGFAKADLPIGRASLPTLCPRMSCSRSVMRGS